MSKKERYHNVLIPETDVLQRKGRDLLRELEKDTSRRKNLLVIPQFFIDEISRLQTSYPYAARIVEVVQKRPHELIENQFVWREYSEGLDVVTVSTDVAKSRSEMKNIIDAVVGRFGQSDQGPIVIASDIAKSEQYRMLDVAVEEPHMFSLDASVINHGIRQGSPKLLAELYGSKNRSIPLAEISSEFRTPLEPNQFVEFRQENGKKVLSRVRGTLRRRRGKIVGIDDVVLELLGDQEHAQHPLLNFAEGSRSSVLGLKPQNMEQYLALQYGLLNRNVDLVHIIGGAGAGKTLLSYVSALAHLVKHLNPSAEPEYERIVLVTPTGYVGGEREQRGYLPGDVIDKAEPHIGGVIANHETMFGHIPIERLLRYETDSKGKDFTYPIKESGEKIAYLTIRKPLLQVKPIADTRGITFNDCIVIIDEAQNIESGVMRTLHQRQGNGKYVVLGDMDQLDPAPGRTRDDNGLIYSVSKSLSEPDQLLMRLPGTQRHRRVHKHSDTF